jgi:hypothetical protein
MNIHIASRMLQYGGSFAKAIADAWVCADAQNRAKLEQAFGDLFQRYSGDEIE